MNDDGRSKEKAIIGMDLGGTKLAAALFMCAPDGAMRFVKSLDNIHYQVFFQKEHGRGLTPEGKSKLIEEAMLGAISALSEAAGGVEISAIGIATAGFVENGMVIEAWNIGMRNYPLRKRIQKASGIKTYIYKDSWAPIYAVSPEKPCIIFSIGTGFGGVSCGPDMQVSLRSYSARKKIKWIPCLYLSDDPGFAASFSVEETQNVIETALAKCASEGVQLPAEISTPAITSELAARTEEYAKKTGKLSPSRFELLFARALAPKAAARLKADEIFADAVCAAVFPSVLYSWIAEKEIQPAEMDSLADGGDPIAAACFCIQAQFIGRVLALMQKERVDAGLPPAEHICATGTGYNTSTEKALGSRILESMGMRATALGLKCALPVKIDLLTCKEGNTTLTCYGAAVGAAKGIVQP